MKFLKNFTNDKYLPAILGGKPTLRPNLKRYLTIGKEERKAVNQVLNEGNLSGFIGAWCPEFFGGTNVKKLERNWESFFSTDFAVSMNSATSCLYAAIAAIGIEPGDEVIVTPTTMTATITGIVLYQAIPVFADICPDTLCISPTEIEKKITKKTKAIIGVNIYGHNAEWSLINEIAQKSGIKVIEDASQSIGGFYKGKRSGTHADIGVFSLNRHKHIHCGEGGVCVTNNEELATRLRLIRNHGEAVVDDMGTSDISGILGFNFRMTEIEASIADQQLKKLDSLIKKRRDMCHEIINIFTKFDGISIPKGHQYDLLKKDNELNKTNNIYYYLCFLFDARKIGLTRESFVEALNKEGIPCGIGGYMPIYLQAMFQKKIAFGKKGNPFTSSEYKKEINYSRGLCPVAERMWFDDLIYVKVQNFIFSKRQIKKMEFAINKIINSKIEINNFHEKRSIK